MPAPWYPTIKATGQLTVFPHPSLATSRWRGVFNDAIRTFNELSTRYSLGVTMTISTTPPSKRDFGGADVQFAAISGGYSLTAFDLTTNNTLDGDGLTGRTHARTTQDRRSRGIGKAFIFVPTAPGSFGGSKRVAGDPAKLVMAVHELVHACGMNEHTLSTDPDIMLDSPSLSRGDRPQDDKLLVVSVTEVLASERSHLARQFVPKLLADVPSKRTRYVLFPPIYLSSRTVGLVQSVWR